MAHGRFEFAGRGLGFLGSYLVNAVLTVITLGLYFPWAWVNEQQWVAKHTRIDGRQLTFRGTGAGLFGTWLLVAFLTIITLGLYLPWGVCRIKRWQTDNLYFADEGDVEKV